MVVVEEVKEVEGAEDVMVEEDGGGEGGGKQRTSTSPSPLTSPRSVSSIVGRLEMSISPAPTHAVAFQKPCVGGGPVPGAKLARSACFSERNVRGRKSRRLVPESTMYLAPPLRSRAPPPPAAVARLVAERREIRARHAQRLQIDPPEVDFFDGYVPVRPALQPTPLLRPY